MNNRIENSNELYVNLADMGNRQYNTLSSDPKEIIDKILKVSMLLIITALGASTLYNLCKNQSKNLCSMAFTGIDATL